MKIKAIKQFLEALPQSVLDRIALDYMKRNNITDSISEVYDLDLLANHLVEWGDAGYGFDITPHLQNKFKEYAYDLLQEEYTIQQIENTIETSQMNFLMDDWEDIILDDYHNTVAFCPHCGELVFVDVPHEYDYDSARLMFECNHCGDWFYK